MQQFTKNIETPHKAKIIRCRKIQLNGIKETLIALVVKGFG